MKINGYDYCESCYYTTKHLWVLMKDNIIRIGISPIFLNRIGSISDIELSYIDNECELEDSIATLYCNSEEIEIYPPLPGKITAVNEDLEDDPTLLSDDPYKHGWLVEMSIDNEQSIKHLLKGDQAESWFRRETERDLL